MTEPTPFPRFIRPRDIRQVAPIAPSTLYKWCHIGKFPQLFRKLGNILLIDVQALLALLESGGAKAKRRAEAAK